MLGKVVEKGGSDEEKRGPLVAAILSDFGELRVVNPINPAAEFWFRASEVASLCPKEEVLCFLHRVQRTQRIDSELDMVFAIGRWYHRMLQTALRDYLVGSWRCRSCFQIVGERAPFPQECPRCRAAVFDYVEPRLENREYKIAGHCDGIALLERERYVVEFKSAGPDMFRSFEPLSDEYMAQVQTYMWLTGVHRAKVLAVAKGKLAFKEIDIEYQPAVVEELKARMKATIEGVTNREPPVGVCEDMDVPRARQCAVRVQCWGLDDLETDI